MSAGNWVPELVEIAGGEELLKVPPWVLIAIGVTLTLLVPFIAYHKMRVKLDTATDTRSRELARLTLVVRDAAAEVVTLSKIGGLEEKTREAYSGYQQAIKELIREAEIQGLRDVVSDHFTTYVGFHIARFLGGIGPIIGGDTQIKRIEIDEYRFVGAMATRADKTILAIKKSFRAGKQPASQSETDSSEQ